MAKNLKTLKQWQDQLEGILLNIREQFLKLGESFYHAFKELSGADYKKLEAYAGQYGLKDADIKSCVAAYLYTRKDLGTETDHRISPELVFAGAKNSKILFMDEQDQQRLVSGEKFQVVMQNGKPDQPKPWSDLTEVARNTLIGKGGKILTVSEQMANMRGKKNAAIYPLGSIEAQKSGLTFIGRDNSMHLKSSWIEVAKMLLLAEHGGQSAWDTLSEAVEEARQGLDDNERRQAE